MPAPVPLSSEHCRGERETRTTQMKDENNASKIDVGLGWGWFPNIAMAAVAGGDECSGSVLSDSNGVGLLTVLVPPRELLPDGIGCAGPQGLSHARFA